MLRNLAQLTAHFLNLVIIFWITDLFISKSIVQKSEWYFDVYENCTDTAKMAIDRLHTCKYRILLHSVQDLVTTFFWIVFNIF